MKSEHQQPRILEFIQSAMTQILTAKEWQCFDKQPMCLQLTSDTGDVLVHNTCDGSSNLKHNDDQRALIKLAKESKQGVTRADAQILVDWAKEYGINNHPSQIHPNRSGIWSYTEHINIYKYHIPIIGD